MFLPQKEMPAVLGLSPKSKECEKLRVSLEFVKFIQARQNAKTCGSHRLFLYCSHTVVWRQDLVLL